MVESDLLGEDASTLELDDDSEDSSEEADDDKITVEAANAINVVLVDFVEHRLLSDTKGVVTVSIELTVAHPAKPPPQLAKLRLPLRLVVSNAPAPKRLLNG